MNTNSSSKNFLTKIGLLVVIIVVILACQAGAAVSVTATPVPTDTPLPTNTSTPKPTSTPRPTSTPKPTATLPPTPAPKGEAVIYGPLEITLLEATTHDLIVPGGQYYWYSKPGEIFIDLGVRVRNLEPGNPITVTWSNIFIVDINGEALYPNFGDYKMVDSGTDYDPYKIGISTEIVGEDELEFDQDTYLRLVFYTVYDPKQSILFGIGDSPLITFVAKQ